MMDNFLIGLWGKFDDEKYIRDFVDGFYGVEVCMFPDLDEVKKLAERARKNRFNWGVHYPLIRKNSSTRDPLFISLSEVERKEAFADFDKEAAMTARYGGKYILAHFPKPVLIGAEFDFTYWRFANEKEWLYEKDYPVELLNTTLREMYSQLNAISKSYDIEIILENDAISPYLFQSSLLCDLFEEFQNVKVCLDIGRLNLQQEVDKSFEGLKFAKKLAPFTSLIHLWNSSPIKNLGGGHLPVSPEQSSADGFADVEAYLKAILEDNKSIKILFEHNSGLISEAELMECYKWVDSIQSKYSGGFYSEKSIVGN